MAHQQQQSSILSTNGSMSAHPTAIAPTDGPKGHHSDSHARGRELGVFTQTHILANGTIYAKP
jgi:hypothetical protein